MGRNVMIVVLMFVGVLAFGIMSAWLHAKRQLPEAKIPCSITERTCLAALEPGNRFRMLYSRHESRPFRSPST